MRGCEAEGEGGDGWVMGEGGGGRDKRRACCGIGVYGEKVTGAC